MILKTRSIATKLLLASSLAAVLVVLGIVAFVKWSMIPQLTNEALKNQTSALAYSLKGIHGRAEQWSASYLAQENVLDSFSNDGKAVATLFLFKDGRYVRMATTLKKEDGTRAVGTALDPASEAARALASGTAYSGHIVLFERLHMATYVPVQFSEGIRGAVFIGVDYASADPMLALSKQMDYLVLGVGVIAVLLLSIGAVYAIRVEEAHRETEDIFRTTQEGIFLLDPQLRMGSQTSQSVSKIMGFEVHPGDNFLELLKPSVSPKAFDTAKEYTELLLRHDVKEKLVASLNPLECIEISSIRPNGGVESRFLQIRFNRVMRGGKVTHLLVTANDISRQVRLERELKESERRVQDQMAMMVHILQADPTLLQGFVDSTTRWLNDVNEEMRTSNSTDGLSLAQIETMLRSAHQLKGDASAMQLEAVTQSLHAFETQLQTVKEQPQRKGEDLLPVAVRVKVLYAEVASIQEVITRIGQVHSLVSVEPPRPHRDPEGVAKHGLVRQWLAFSDQLAQRHGKKVELNYLGIDLDKLGQNLRETLNSMINQFIRNALVHGVETPAERVQRGKPETAHLSVYISDQGDGSVELSFRDDGRGINPDSIRETLVRCGKYTAEAAAALTPRELTLLIFEPGFSTREAADEDAGRGIGLDAVKALIARRGGRIRVGSTRGEYCHFRVQLPLKAEEDEAPQAEEAMKEVA